jgi:cytochrome c oxidase assembly protein subunit 15
VLLGLGGLQGLVGWWMVSSGLSERVSVAPERLMIHLGLALALFVFLIWTALDAWSGSPRIEERTDWRGWALGFLGAVFFQSLLGALVAGNDAGLVYNDWPLMNGALIPRRICRPWLLGHAGPQPGGGATASPADGLRPVRRRHRPRRRRDNARAACRRRPRLTRLRAGRRVCLQAGLGIWTLMTACRWPWACCTRPGGDPAGHGHDLRLAGAAALTPFHASGRSLGCRSKNCHETPAQDVGRPCWSFP